MSIPRSAPRVRATCAVPPYPRATSESDARYLPPSRGLLAVACPECQTAGGMACAPYCPAARAYVANLHGLLRALVSGPCLICSEPEGGPCRERLGFAGNVAPIADYGAMAPALYLDTLERVQLDPLPGSAAHDWDD